MTRLVWFRNDLRVTDHPALVFPDDANGSARVAASATTGSAGPRGAAAAPAAGLSHASRTASLQLLPVFIFPPRLFGTTSFGFPKVGPHRARFLIETVEDLQRALQQRGSDLIVAQGPPAQVLMVLARRFGVDEIWYQDEAGTEEAAEVAELTAAARGSRVDAGPTPNPAVAHGLTPSVQLRPYYGQTLYHPEDLPFAIEEMPVVYTDFRKAVEKGASVRPVTATATATAALTATASPARLPPLPPLPASSAEIRAALQEHAAERGASSPSRVQPPGTDVPAAPVPAVSVGIPTVEALSGSSAPAPDPRAAIHFTGGETAAWQRLNTYFWERDQLRRYKHTRNGLVGADYSSKFSPWLSNGSLSPRSIVAEVRRYEAERVKNSSTYWLVFELIWRDYFAFLLRKFGGALFRFEGPMNRRPRWSTDWTRFSAWREGTTGQDFIDANMREIAVTGYMSNRGRQNVASYLARDLKVNWLMGAEYFESQLIDYDPASNYGNWTYTVGVGTDPRRDRYFNPEVQSAKYDPDARYRLHWLRGPSGSI